jgi:hypothetical protein
MKKTDWSFLFEKGATKLEGWSSRYLSKVGRYILLNSVITYIPIFSILQDPKSIWKKLDVMRKRFFWKGASHQGASHQGAFLQPLKWDSICKPKKIGGMGVRSLKEFNDALLLKWAVRLLQGGKKCGQK